MKSFSPYEYIGRAEKGVVQDIDITGMKKVYDICEEVRIELRTHHGSIFSSSIISPRSREQVKLIIADFIKERPELHIPNVALEKLIEVVQDEVVNLGPIQKALDDPRITNIDINGPRDIFVELDGEEVYLPDIESEAVFRDEEHLFNTIQKMLIPVGRSLSANDPVVDTLFDGFRVCATLKASRAGISTYSHTVSIRKFPEETITPDDLIKFGSINKEIKDFLQDAVLCSNIEIAGSTNSGKTSFLMTLPMYLSKNTRIITIEDSPEMMLRKRKAFKDYRNIIAFQCKHHEEKEKAYDIAKLTKVSLRKRPNYIIVGEVRDSEAASQTLEAMNTGHYAYFTVHASSAKEGAIRIVQLAGNNETVAAQVASTINLIIFQQKRRKSRIVTEIIELLDFEGAKRPIYKTLFKFVQTGVTDDGHVIGEHKRVNPISEGLAEQMRNALIPEENILRWMKGSDEKKGSAS